jgi:hypothetical protein
MLSNEYLLKKRKRLRKFSKMDFINEVVTQERVREIITDIKEKTESIKNLNGSELIIKDGNKILIALSDLNAFKEYDAYEKINLNLTLDPEVIKNHNELAFFAKVKRYNFDLMNFEALVLYMQNENEKKQFLDKLELFHKEHEAKTIDEVNYQNQIRSLIQERMREINHQITIHNMNIEKIMAYKKQLQTIIQEHEKIIREKRGHYSEQLLKKSDNIEINGKKIFRQIPHDQKAKFFDGLLAANEIRSRKIHEIKNKYEKIKSSSNINSISNANGKRGLLHGYAVSQQSTYASKLKADELAEIAQVNSEFKHAIKSLSSATAISELIEDKNLDSFLNHETIDSVLSEHDSSIQQNLSEISQALEEDSKCDLLLVREMEIKQKLIEEGHQLKENYSSIEIDNVLDAVLKEDKDDGYTTENCILNKIGDKAIDLSKINFDELDFSSPQVSVTQKGSFSPLERS